MPEYQQNSSNSDTLPDGEYEFTVKKASLGTSKNGNEKIELVLEIKGGATVYDNLVFTEKAFWKIDQFRIATGEKLDSSAKVNFEAEHCEGRTGQCHLITETFEGRSRNRVEAYLFPSATKGTGAAKAAGRPVPTAGIEPDDIPF